MPTVDLNQLEPVEGNPFDMTPGILAHGYGTLSADNPSWGNRLAGAFSNAMGWLGATPQGQRNAYDVAQTASGLIPGVNNAISANQAYRDWNQGNYLGAGVNAVSAAIPPVPGASNLTAGAGRGILSAAEETAPSMIRAFHGSPETFEAFQHPGLGVEGYGHYFTTDPKMASRYGGPTGQLYEANISHDPAKFFDLDAPYSEQHPEVQSSLDKLGASKEGTGKDALDSLIGVESDHDEWIDKAYEAYEKMRDAGIPGTKWKAYEPDAAPGSINYGVFNPDSIKIVNRDPTDPRALSNVLKTGPEPIGGRVIMEGGTPGLLAYHGSRHDFPSFDINAINTGEGAQVYGHGLYFAEHPDVAEGYRTAGGSSGLLDPSGNPVKFLGRPDVTDDWGPESVAHDYLRTHGDFGAAINEARGDEDTATAKYLEDMQEQGYQIHPGYKYQVGIAHDPDKFFDLDSKFGDMHPDTQAALNQVAGRKFPKDMSGNDVYDHLVEHLDKFPEDFPDYAKQVDLFGDQADPHVGLANELNKAGVPGVRYLDEGSRSPAIKQFGGDDLLSNYPPDVQNRIRELVPDAQLNDDIYDIHDRLYNKEFNEAMEAAGDDKDKISDVWATDYIGATRDKMIKAGAKLLPDPALTRNYVTFSDKNINILKKWGAGGALLVGGTGAASAQDFYKQHPDLDRYSLTDSADGQ